MSGERPTAPFLGSAPIRFRSTYSPLRITGAASLAAGEPLHWLTRRLTALPSLSSMSAIVGRPDGTPSPSVDTLRSTSPPPVVPVELQRLKLRNRVQLAVRAVEHGLYSSIPPT